VDVPERFPGVLDKLLAPVHRSVDVLDKHLGPGNGSVDGTDSIPLPVHRSVDGLRAHHGTLEPLAAVLSGRSPLSDEERNDVGEVPEPVLPRGLRSASSVRERRRVALTLREFDVLAMLIERAGEVVTRRELALRIDSTASSGSNIVDVHMSRIPDKLGDHASAIETVRGVGYRFGTR
jgi:hypothetical protein